MQYWTRFYQEDESKYSRDKWMFMKIKQIELKSSIFKKENISQMLFFLLHHLKSIFLFLITPATCFNIIFQQEYLG